MFISPLFQLEVLSIPENSNGDSATSMSPYRKSAYNSVDTPPPETGKIAHFGRMFGDEPGRRFRPNKNPPFTRHSQGINLYLRLGAVGKLQRTRYEIKYHNSS